MSCDRVYILISCDESCNMSCDESCDMSCDSRVFVDDSTYRSHSREAAGHILQSQVRILRRWIVGVVNDVRESGCGQKKMINLPPNH